jgi:hypothetical protein
MIPSPRMGGTTMPSPALTSSGAACCQVMPDPVPWISAGLVTPCL